MTRLTTSFQHGNPYVRPSHPARPPTHSQHTNLVSLALPLTPRPPLISSGKKRPTHTRPTILVLSGTLRNQPGGVVRLRARRCDDDTDDTHVPNV